MSFKKVLSGLLLALFVFTTFSIQAEEVRCYPPLKASDPKATFATKINDSFGGLVGTMATILFWQPVAFEVTDAAGNPVMQQVPVKDASGNTHKQVFLVRDVDGKPSVDTSYGACLDKNGKIKTSDSGQPLLTKWTLLNGKFSHSVPKTSEHKYYKDESGKFFQKARLIQTAGTSPQKNGIPMVVLVLMFGAIFYTLFYAFPGFRLFKHAVDCVRGVYDNPKDPGEISHLQALTSALSGTVGLGNIAGVAVAVGVGGPGAVFWMILLGLLGMASKFHECTLGMLYRDIDPDGRVFGGPNIYLAKGFKDLGLAPIGKILAVLFSIIVIAASIGGGNMFQANQSFMALAGEIPALHGQGFWFGVGLAALVGVVIIGGIKRIGTVTEKLVPSMVAIYLLVSLWIIITHIGELPHIFGLIFSKAFSFEAGLGGFAGIAVQGIRRAVFSNEAGLGSASFAHSAAKTEEPVREGIVALLGPFIDTVVICTMTALVVLITGAYDNPIAGQGVAMTRFAFASKVPWFPTVLSIAVFLFALSTMITWAYYGEKAWAYLFGHSRKVGLIYKVIYLCFAVVGCMVSLGNVIDFTDLVFLSLAVPNIVGGVFLSGKVAKALKAYQQKLKAGQFARYK